MLFGRRRLVQVPDDVEGEVRGGDQSQRVVPRVIPRHRGPIPERGVRRRLAYFVGADHQHHVVQTRRDGHGSISDRIITCGTSIFDASDRDVGQVEGVGQNARREAVGGGQFTEPRRFDLMLLDALVDIGNGLGVRHRHQVLNAELEVLGERCHPGADHGDVSHAPTPSESIVRPGQNAYP